MAPRVLKDCLRTGPRRRPQLVCRRRGPGQPPHAAAERRRRARTGAHATRAREILRLVAVAISWLSSRTATRRRISSSRGVSTCSSSSSTFWRWVRRFARSTPSTFRLRPPAVNRPQAVLEHARRHRLEHDAAGAEPRRGQQVVLVVAGGEHHDRGRLGRIEPPQQAQPVVARQLEVEHEHVRLQRSIA